MKHLVFTSLANTKARNAQAFAEGMATGLFPEGTVQYAAVIKNPFQNLYALPVDKSFLSLFSPQELASAVDLSQEWFQKGKIAGTFVIQQPISPLAANPLVSRIAFCNLPAVLEDREKTFELTVIVRHYRDGIHIWEEMPDRKVVLTADNVEGEFDTFYAYFAQGANIHLLIGQNILYRDSVAGGRRFD